MYLHPLIRRDAHTATVGRKGLGTRTPDLFHAMVAWKAQATGYER